MTLNTELIISLTSVQTQMLKRVEQHLSIHGISFSEFLVMYHLNNAPNMTMRRIDLAECIGLSASGVTRLVSPMEKNHLVEKESNPRDARVSLVHLSKTGAELLEYAKVSFEQSADSFLKPFNNKQITTFLELTKTLL